MRTLYIYLSAAGWIWFVFALAFLYTEQRRRAGGKDVRRWFILTGVAVIGVVFGCRHLLNRLVNG